MYSGIGLIKLTFCGGATEMGKFRRRKAEISFDPAKRSAYVGGFKKRKEARRLAYQKAAEEREKAQHKAELKSQRKRQAEVLAEMTQLAGKTNKAIKRLLKGKKVLNS